MKEDTLLTIKNELAGLYKAIQAVNKVWNNPVNQMVEVLVQNSLGDKRHTVGYSHEKECESIRTIYKALEELKKYSNYHFIDWVFMEYSTTVDGHVMSEYYDSSIP